MNLSPDWLPLLREHGFEAVHWSGLVRRFRRSTQIAREKMAACLFSNLRKSAESADNFCPSALLPEV